MGTRADFYVGEGQQAEWLGSIGHDGYPEAINRDILCAQTVEQYRHATQQFLVGRDDATLPAHGWPWPWDDSRLTDYAYCFVGQVVKMWIFGHGPFNPHEPETDAAMETEKGLFPDMSAWRNVAYGIRSGLMIIQGPR